MDLFKEIDEFNDLLLFEKNAKLDSEVEGYEDLQTKYSSLHENYEKEIENSKKVEKCLVKCLKYYSKLCKKYEVQQKIILGLEENIKEKISSLEEAQRNELKLKGLIQVYRTERTLYVGQTNTQLRKDKELLLEICCKLISDSAKSSSTRNLTNLLLRKFKGDLDDEKLKLLKGKNIMLKDEPDIEGKPDILEVKNEVELKSEDNYSCAMTKVEVKEQEEDAKNDPLDLSISRVMEEESNSVNIMDSNQGCETEIEKPGDLPELENFEKEVGNCEIEVGNCGIEVGNCEKKDGKCGIEVGNCGIEVGNCEKEVGNCGIEVGNCDFEKEARSDGHCTINNSSKINLDVMESEEESPFPYENELSKIFREMASVKLLSPLRESNNSPISDMCTVAPNENETSSGGNSDLVLKRNSEMGENSCRSKKFKPEEEQPNCGLLDCIMSAMSLQNEEFKSNGISEKGVKAYAEPGISSPSRFRNLGTRTYSRVKKLGSGCSKENSVVCQNSGSSSGKQQTVEKLVADEIKKFISSPISSKEDADANVKRCISVLSNKPEDVIAKCIVAVVLENVDEAVEMFERPAPPLTKTQHRLIVLLSVFQSVDSTSEKLSTKILSIISEKLFPDNFFWPDDSVEAAIRFYAALCRLRNDAKTLWRFCLQAMTDMRQRCPLLMFTALKTWPDVLHDASTLKNNLLALTMVNIFLHMSKTEGLRNFNQGRKLVALKHLLMNFYQFKVEDTIENYARKVLDAVCRDELGSEKSIILLAKCRDRSWTEKNVVPTLKSRLSDWCDGKLEDSAASRILSVTKQICPILLQDVSNVASVKELVSCLSDILTSRKMSHSSEVSVIEVLLQLKQYPHVRQVIREWIPKNPIGEDLRNEIIDASAENILRELKLNRKKDPRSSSVKRKVQKQSKKLKGKKKRGKKRKKSESPRSKEARAEPAVC